MKRIIIMIVYLTFFVVSVFAQNFRVQVLPFEAKEGVSASDTEVVTGLFSTELIKTGRIQIENPPNYHIRGTLTHFAGELILITRIIDLSSQQIVSSTFSRLNDMGQLLTRLPGIATDLVRQLSSSRDIIPQYYVVQLNPLELRGGLSTSDLDGITELITQNLVESGLKVAWGNNNQNVTHFLQGSVVSLAGQIVITASIVDTNTNQPITTATLQLGNIGEIYDSNRANISSQWNSFRNALIGVPFPVAAVINDFFVGRWEMSFNDWERDGRHYYGQTNTVINRPSQPLVCILEIKSDGTIIVERFDTITYNHSMRRPTIGRDQHTYSYRNLNRNGTGTGTVTSLRRNGIDTIRMTINLNLRGLEPGIPSSQTFEVILNLSSPSSFFVYRYLLNVYNLGGPEARRAESVKVGNPVFRRISQ
jgi:TolB-like protein